MHYSTQKSWMKFNEFSGRSPSRGDRVGWAGRIATSSPPVGVGREAEARCPVETNTTHNNHVWDNNIIIYNCIFELGMFGYIISTYCITGNRLYSSGRG